MFKLQDMRSQKHIGWFVKIGFGIIIISFVFFYGWDHSSSQEAQGRQVQGEIKSDSLFKRRDKITAKMALDAKGAAIGDKQMMLGPNFARQVNNLGMGDSLITDKDAVIAATDKLLLSRIAESKGIAVSFESMIGMLEQMGATNVALANVAKQNGLSARAYVDRMRYDKALQNVRSLQLTSVQKSLYDAWNDYRMDNEKVVLELVTYPASDFESSVTVEQDALTAYFKEHSSMFYVPAKRCFDYAKLTREAIEANIVPTDEQMMAYYNENLAKYLPPKGIATEEIKLPIGNFDESMQARKLLESIREQAIASQDWASLVQKLNADNPGNHFSLGEYSTQLEPSKKDTYEIYYDDLFKSVEQGQVSLPTLLGNEFALVRVKQRDGVKSFEDVREQVAADAKRSLGQTEFDKTIAKLRDEVRQLKKLSNDASTTDPIKLLASKMGMEDGSTTFVSITDAYIPGVGLFMNDQDYIAKLSLGELSDPIASSNEIVILKVTEFVDGYDPSIDEVHDKVVSAYRRANSVGLAREAAEAALRRVAEGSTFKQAMGEAASKAKLSSPFSRGSSVDVINSQLIDFKEQTHFLKAGEVGVSPYGYDEKNPMGYAFWQAREIDPPSYDSFMEMHWSALSPSFDDLLITFSIEWQKDLRTQADFKIIENGKKDKEETETDSAKTPSNKTT